MSFSWAGCGDGRQAVGSNRDLFIHLLAECVLQFAIGFAIGLLPCYSEWDCRVIPSGVCVCVCVYLAI